MSSRYGRSGRAGRTRHASSTGNTAVSARTATRSSDSLISPRASVQSSRKPRSSGRSTRPRYRRLAKSSRSRGARRKYGEAGGASSAGPATWYSGTPSALSPRPLYQTRVAASPGTIHAGNSAIKDSNAQKLYHRQAGAGSREGSRCEAAPEGSMRGVLLYVEHAAEGAPTCNYVWVADGPLSAACGYWSSSLSHFDRVRIMLTTALSST